MASAEMPPAPPSVATPPLSNPGLGSTAAATTTVPSTSKKQEHLVAGRRKLQEYRKKKAEEKKSIERNRTAGLVSEGPLPNTLPEEELKKTKESSSIPLHEDVLGNGSCIIPEKGAKAHFHAVTLDGMNTRDQEQLEGELKKEDNNAESSKDVKKSSDLWTEGTSRTVEEDSHFPKKLELEFHNLPNASGDASGSISSSLFKATGVKLLPNDSVSGHSNSGESANNRIAGSYSGKVHLINKESASKTDVFRGNFISFDSGGYLAKGHPVFSKQDSIGVLSDAPLSNGEGDYNLKRTVGASHSFPSTVSLDNSLTAPAFPEQQGHVLKREKTGQEQSDYQFDDFVGVKDMKFGDTAAPTEKQKYRAAPTENQFLFVPSKQPTPFYMNETKPIFSLRPSDSFSHGPAAASTSSNLSMPLRASTAAASGKTLAIPTSTSEGDMLNKISTIRHGVGSSSHSAETQRNSERDDFAALEQYIADLTQEKFSLQRALDAARSLTETLAQENTALTEDFNSQGAVINQLQGDIDRQMEEINAQSLVLNGIMVEREKAQQESNSAVERSQILAGEVIGLEEKVLKLRSNELKLERDMEILKSEIDTSRRQLLTLEKDRQNLRSMVETLQEDKKLLQGQLRKKLAGPLHSQMSIEKGAVAKKSKDASTSTDDLDDLQTTTTGEHEEQALVEEMKGSYHLSERVNNSFDGASFSTLSQDRVSLNTSPALAALPVDHFRIINNIDLLITELEIEKESLIKSVQKESKKASELEALNAELSKKLEIQTQRLELAFAQNLAHEATAVITSPNDEHQDNEFVDEGDEIVERVLGWIARLFPSGSSKRRTSKLL